MTQRGEYQPIGRSTSDWHGASEQIVVLFGHKGPACDQDRPFSETTPRDGPLGLGIACSQNIR